MIALLSQLLDTIKSLVTFAINFINSIVYLLGRIPSYVSFLSTSINVLPSFIIPFCVICISTYVLLFTLGRQG